MFESSKAGRGVVVGAGVEGFVLICSYAFWNVLIIAWNVVHFIVILSILRHHVSLVAD